MALLLAVPARRAAGQTPPPGRAYLFTLDLAGTPLDELPAGVKALSGVMTVVDQNGQHMLRASSPSELLITPTDAIAKMTIMPARRLERGTPVMRRKGRLSVGADADITILDYRTVLERATVEHPEATVRS